MATRTQIKANRDNAKKSTGPRTKQGKARVAKNALKHGLLARDTVLPGEDPADFDSQLIALEADIGPANSLEFELVRQIAGNAQVLIVAGAAPSASGNLLWRTPPGVPCRHSWRHRVQETAPPQTPPAVLPTLTNYKLPNKPNFAEPQ